MDSFQLGQGVFFAASREANSEDPHPRTPVRGSPTTHHPPPNTEHRTPNTDLVRFPSRLRGFA